MLPSTDDLEFEREEPAKTTIKIGGIKFNTDSVKILPLHIDSEETTPDHTFQVKQSIPMRFGFLQAKPGGDAMLAKKSRTLNEVISLKKPEVDLDESSVKTDEDYEEDETESV